MATKLIKILYTLIKYINFAPKFKKTMKDIKTYWKNAGLIGRLFFWTLLVLGVILVIVSYFLPPTGEINSSVLEAVGLIQSFATIGWGFELLLAGKKNVELTKGDMSVKVTETE